MKQRRKNPYKKGIANHLASSLALLPRGTQRSVDRGWAGWAMELRKHTTRTPTRLICAEGNMDRSDNASSCSVRRGRRPHSTSRNFMHENRETSETPAAKPGGRSAGEGLGHTTRAHVSEESHSGVVPMNHSNKDTRTSAESGEGRPLIKENAGQPSTHPTQSGDRVSQGLAGARKAARENKEMRFTALLHHLTVDLLREG